VKFVKKLLCWSLLLFIFSASPVHAQKESWYTFWSFGNVKHNYPGDLNDAFEATASLPGVYRVEGVIDILGFYVPLGNKTILGLIVSGSFDRLTDGVVDFQFNQYLYGASVMHFFGKEPGQGFFFRGDYGVSKIAIQSSGIDNITSESGTGYLVGAGYGLAVSEESRLIIGVNYASNTIKNEIFQSTNFIIGGLW